LYARVDGRGRWEQELMASFEQSPRTDDRDSSGLEDDELELALLTSSREAFAGFSNLAAFSAPLTRWDVPPWRVR
jgi:hypothetical protein